MPDAPFTPYLPLEVFAVDHDSVQVTWRNQPVGPIEVRAGGSVATAVGDAGPGAVTLHGVAPDAVIDVTVTTTAASHTLACRTLPEPPTAHAAIATISDLHLGEDGFGLLFDIDDDSDDPVPYTLRCARAAIAEATDWGAEMLVVKGDLTHGSKSEQWDLVEHLLEDISIPVLLAPGNHDGRRSGRDPHVALSDLGHPIDDGLVAAEHAGALVVLADTMRTGSDLGRLHRFEDQLCTLARDHDGPVFVGLHHHLQMTPLPWFWPIGIGWLPARRFLRRLAEANPRCIVSSGHTHRNRRHTRAALAYTEVSSTKDFPGVWAGYRLADTGAAQTVRRIEAPTSLEWTERSRRAVAGIWGRWSQGTLDQRSFAVDF